MKVDVLIGLQWGDEGKGKIVDVLTPKYDVITRFQGGPNAGHSLKFKNINHVLHSIPSGIFHPNKINVIGNGVVIDPIIFQEEIEEISKLGINLRKNLYISKRAHLILPSHRLLDKASELAKGKTKIGSTLKGIGPTYMDKTGRNGLRVGDILEPDFKTKYKQLTNKHKELLPIYNYSFFELEDELTWFEGIETMKQFNIVDSEYELNSYLGNNKSILAEGAQGTLLDIDFGSYPFVTSSSTICAGACTGLGIAPNKIGEVIGIFKAYCTRVGSGPFPTEEDNETGELIRKKGHEYGATTGRPRRCGWLDIPALNYSIMINGVTQLIMMKSDVLSGFNSIKVCTGYKTKNGVTNKFPYKIDDSLKPVYKEFQAWKEELVDVKSKDKLPEELIKYIKYIENEVNVPIVILSVGPDRSQTINLK